MNSPRKFRKKPVVIEAMRVTYENVTPIIDWVLAGDGTARYHERTIEGIGGEPAHIAIDTLEGTMRASIGDYVIRGVAGEFYPCNPDIFAATYEAVTE